MEQTKKMNFSSQLKNEIREILNDSLRLLQHQESQKNNGKPTISRPEGIPLPMESPVYLEKIREEKFGDYACTSAMNRELRCHFMKLKKAWSQPRIFAQEFCNTINQNKEAANLLEAAEIAGPGYINLTITTERLLQYLKKALQENQDYGHTTASKSKKIILEFVSANPTGPLNVVSARAAALGDSCANLLRAAGHQVSCEYYVNDCGNQIKLLGQSYLGHLLEFHGIPIKFPLQQEGSDEAVYPDTPAIPFPPNGYYGEYLKEMIGKEMSPGNLQGYEQEHAQDNLKEKTSDEKKTKKAINTLPPSSLHSSLQNLLKLKGKEWEQFLADSQRTDLPPSFLSQERFVAVCDELGRKAAEIFLSQQKEILQQFRIKFDCFFSERELHDSSQLPKSLKKLEKNLYQKEGCTYFGSTKYGDDKDRVLIKSDGTPTYFLADIAYHDHKAQRGFTDIYNIWGPDHHGYIARLAGAIKDSGFRGKFKVWLAQQIHLKDGTKQIRMSKRAGKLITMAQLLQEVPVNVLRYFFIMRSFDSPMDFDLAEAKDTSEKNPYYYAAYAHARICSIFRKAEELNIHLPKNLENFSSCFLDFNWSLERRRILLQIARFPEEVSDSANSMEPHRMIQYISDLASSFSQFYVQKENRVIKQDQKTATCLLVLLKGASICLKNGLSLLGMDAPERL